MKPVIASASLEASAKYIFTVNPLPNLHKGDFTNKAQCYYLSEGRGWGSTVLTSKMEHLVAQRTMGEKNSRLWRGKVGRGVIAGSEDEQRSLTCS